MSSSRRGAIASGQCARALFATLLVGIALADRAPGQIAADVSVRFTLKSADGKLFAPSTNAPVVVWLSPVSPSLSAPTGPTDPGIMPGAGKSFQMAQKDKMFQPHLLVVPVGSHVAFPNRDPYFHNVFSLFNGRRFDLGLYETGASHSVPFNREGVSYIFCNIHPEMGAIIVSVDTPFFAVATQSTAQLRGVPPGEYLLKAWAEDATGPSLQKASRRIRVGRGDNDAGTVEIVLQPRQAHTDKFGKPYAQHTEGQPY